MAVFARAGAEIPLGPASMSTAETGGGPEIVEIWRG
jgi:hypothetical protein